MRYQIDYRWILTTSVVIGVAAAGTAAIVRQGSGNSDFLNPDSAAEVSLTRSERVAAYIEPARLSHDGGGSNGNLSSFEPGALPKMFAQPDRSGQAAEFSRHFGPSWSSRTAEMVAARSSGGGWWSHDARFGGGFGWSGRSIGGGGGGGGSTHAPAQTPRPRPNASSNGNPRPPTARPAPSAPSAPPGPGRPNTPGDVPAAPVILPPSGPGVLPAEPGPGDSPIGDPPPVDPGPLSPTPEPASLMLIGTGLVGIYGALRRHPRS